MKLIHNRNWLIALALLALATSAWAAYEINWYTIDGGGGTSSAGLYTIRGTIGQPDAGTMTGGPYALAGGFWLGGTFCYVDLEDLAGFLTDWLDSGDLPGNLDYPDNPVPTNPVDLADFSILAAHWLTYCPPDWPL